MNIKIEPSILDNIEIATPCTISWDSMQGTAFVRDCPQCKLSVYNISELSKEEAEKLIKTHEGKLCIRLYRRQDGTVITNDCPVALRKLKQSINLTMRAAAALISLFLGCTAVKAADSNVAKTDKINRGSPVLTKQPPVIMGEATAVPNKTVENNQPKASPIMGQLKSVNSKQPAKVWMGAPEVQIMGKVKAQQPTPLDSTTKDSSSSNKSK